MPRLTFPSVGWIILLFTSSCGAWFNNKLPPRCIPEFGGMAGWWTGRQIRDGSAVDLNGNSSGTLSSVSVSTGKYGNGFQFKNYLSSIQVPDHPAFSFSQAITALAWAKISGNPVSPTSQFIITKAARNSSLDSSQVSYFDYSKMNPTIPLFQTATFDGRYVYFPGVLGGSSGFFSRYDTYSTEPFSISTSASWAEANVSSLRAGLDIQASFSSDGRYFYGTFYNTNGNAIASKFDPQSAEPFASPSSSSWNFLDLANLGGPNASNLAGGSFFDGRYVYFAPSKNTSSLVARYDTLSTEAFSNSTLASWSFRDLFIPSLGGTNAFRFTGAIYDGRYIYFPTWSTAANAMTARYDTFTSEDFSTSTLASWSFVKLNALSGGTTAYSAGVFDGRYLYMIPFGGTVNGRVARYDTLTTESFGTSTLASWSFFDVSTLNSQAKGFDSALFDGTYIYLVPRNNGSPNGLIARYNTQATEAFGSATSNSWTFFDLAQGGAIPNAVGYIGGAFDGRYLYFSPRFSPTSTFSKIDTTGGQSSFELKAQSLISDGRSSNSLGPSFGVHTDKGFFQVTSTQLLNNSQWHLVAGTYDGVNVKIYVDGVLAASRPASGTLLKDSNPITIGSFTGSNLGFNGMIDEAQVYSKALLGSEIAALYSKPICQ